MGTAAVSDRPGEPGLPSSAAGAGQRDGTRGSGRMRRSGDGRAGTGPDKGPDGQEVERAAGSSRRTFSGRPRRGLNGAMAQGIAGAEQSETLADRIIIKTALIGRIHTSLEDPAGAGAAGPGAAGTGNIPTLHLSGIKDGGVIEVTDTAATYPSDGAGGDGGSEQPASAQTPQSQALSPGRPSSGDGHRRDGASPAPPACDGAPRRRFRRRPDRAR